MNIRGRVGGPPQPRSPAYYDPQELDLGDEVELTMPNNETTAEVFRRVDMNGNGLLSLAELDKAVQQVWPRFNNKPVIMRAYRACDVDGSGLVSRTEFRLFLKFLQRYQQLYTAFQRIDVDGDRRLTLKELLSRANAIGLGNRSPGDLRAFFRRADKNGGGVVLFEEFADAVAGAEIEAARGAAKPDAPRRREAPVGTPSMALRRGLEEVELTMPNNETTAEVFRRVDMNGNGLLSLAELDKAVQQVWPRFNNKPVIMRAYRACDVDGSGLVSRTEFRLFLKFLQRYQQLYTAFQRIDVDGDRRLTLKELLSRANAIGLGNRSPEDLRAFFRRADKNGGGVVLFEEFADALVGTEIEAARQHLRSRMRTVSKEPPKRPVFLEFPTVANEKNLFDRLDCNRNGVLSLAELDKAVVQLWPRFNNKPALMRAYKAADRNGNGWLGRSEFRAFLTFLVVYQNLWEQFKALDTNGDRRLNLEEFLKSDLVSNRSRREAIEIFRALDTDRAGCIIFDEYCAHEAGATMQALVQQGGDVAPEAAPKCPVPLMCVYCGRMLADLSAHSAECECRFRDAMEKLPSFLRREVPHNPVPMPLHEREAEHFNATAEALYKTLGVFECPECTKRFTVHTFLNHFKTHNITYNRRMQLEQRKGYMVTKCADVPLPVQEGQADRDGELLSLKSHLVAGYDLAPLALCRRLLHMEKQTRANTTPDALRRLIMKCNTKYPLTPQGCSALLAADEGEGNVQALLSALDGPLLSPARMQLVQSCFHDMDSEGSGSIMYRTLRQRMAHPSIVSTFTRPLEKPVSFREFEQVVKDVSILVDSDSQFRSLIELNASKSGVPTNEIVVRATMISGETADVAISTPAGSLVRTDKSSLMRRLRLLGLSDVVRVELL